MIFVLVFLILAVGALEDYCDKFLGDEVPVVELYDGFCWVLNMHEWYAQYGDYTGKSFYDGENYCVSIGGHLASFHNTEEWNIVKDFSAYVYAQDSIGYVWVGASYFQATGWTWNDGTTWWSGGDSLITNNQEVGDARSTDGVNHLHTYGSPATLNDYPDWWTNANAKFRTLCKVPVPTVSEPCDVYNDASCPNYEGTYVPGKGQIGFDEEHFKTESNDQQIRDIDGILEEMETGFEDEADVWEGELTTAFGAKETAYNEVTAAETAYVTAMGEREAAESNYNAKRIAEEAAHQDLVTKIGTYDQKVIDYAAKHADYIEKIDFLNYELFIVQQIRELLGEKIGYIPEQVILEKTAYDETYDGWTTNYPNIMTSTFTHETQRFNGAAKRKRRRKRRRKKKRMGKKNKKKRMVRRRRR